MKHILYRAEYGSELARILVRQVNCSSGDSIQTGLLHTHSFSRSLRQLIAVREPAEAAAAAAAS